jgi:hypothetical protein
VTAPPFYRNCIIAIRGYDFQKEQPRWPRLSLPQTQNGTTMSEFRYSAHTRLDNPALVDLCLDRFHIRIRETEMMAYLVHQHMRHDGR